MPYAHTPIHVPLAFSNALLFDCGETACSSVVSLIVYLLCLSFFFCSPSMPTPAHHSPKRSRGRHPSHAAGRGNSCVANGGKGEAVMVTQETCGKKREAWSGQATASGRATAQRALSVSSRLVLLSLLHRFIYIIYTVCTAQCLPLRDPRSLCVPVSDSLLLPSPRTSQPPHPPYRASGASTCSQSHPKICPMHAATCRRCPCVSSRRVSSRWMS